MASGRRRKVLKDARLHGSANEYDYEHSKKSPLRFLDRILRSPEFPRFWWPRRSDYQPVLRDRPCFRRIFTIGASPEWISVSRHCPGYTRSCRASAVVYPRRGTVAHTIHGYLDSGRPWF